MKVELCDLCKDDIHRTDGALKIKVKREHHSLLDNMFDQRWQDLDICASCAEKLVKIAPNDTDKEFGKYPSNDYINNAIRLLWNNKNRDAIEELLRAVKKADGNIFDDVKEKIKAKYTDFNRSLL